MRKLTTLESSGQRMVCEKSFNVNGDQAVSSYTAPLGGPPNETTATSTGTERVCG